MMAEMRRDALLEQVERIRSVVERFPEEPEFSSFQLCFDANTFDERMTPPTIRICALGNQRGIYQLAEQLGLNAQPLPDLSTSHYSAFGFHVPFSQGGNFVTVYELLNDEKIKSRKLREAQH